jgi:formylglycine-generating enzyme required for sulfatase activity
MYLLLEINRSPSGVSTERGIAQQCEPVHVADRTIEQGIVDPENQPARSLFQRRLRIRWASSCSFSKRSGCQPVRVASGSMPIGAPTLPRLQPDNLAGFSFHDRLADGAPGPQMQLIPPGTFVMGSPDHDPGAGDSEKPQHQVTIAQTFALGRYPGARARA